MLLQFGYVFLSVKTFSSFLLSMLKCALCVIVLVSIADREGGCSEGGTRAAEGQVSESCPVALGRKSQW